jgi:hypothetical protein
MRLNFLTTNLNTISIQLLDSGKDSIFRKKWVRINNYLCTCLLNPDQLNFCSICM